MDLSSFSHRCLAPCLDRLWVPLDFPSFSHRSQASFLGYLWVPLDLSSLSHRSPAPVLITYEFPLDLSSFSHRHLAPCLAYIWVSFGSSHRSWPPLSRLPMGFLWISPLLITVPGTLVWVTHGFHLDLVTVLGPHCLSYLWVSFGSLLF